MKKILYSFVIILLLVSVVGCVKKTSPTEVPTPTGAEYGTGSQTKKSIVGTYTMEKFEQVGGETRTKQEFLETMKMSLTFIVTSSGAMLKVNHTDTGKVEEESYYYDGNSMTTITTGEKVYTYTFDEQDTLVVTTKSGGNTYVYTFVRS